MKQEVMQEGVLCQLKMGRWDASIRMSKDKFGKELPKEIVRAMQDLVEDRTLIKNLDAIRRSAKNTLKNNSLPFPVDGIFWCPKDKIPLLDDCFTKLKVDYREATEILVRNLPIIKRNFRKRYPKFYDNNFYPTASELRKKHHFDWNFFHFVVPDQKSEILSPALYKREKAKFQAMVDQMEELTVNLIGNELMKRIETLQEQCDNDSISAGTVNSVERFIDKWRELWEGNIDNKKLHSIMKTLKAQMKKTSAEKLKDSESFREAASAKLEKIIGRIKNVPNIELKRKLDV
jgi:hypothetical protein